MLIVDTTHGITLSQPIAQLNAPSNSNSRTQTQQQQQRPRQKCVIANANGDTFNNHATIQQSTSNDLQRQQHQQQQQPQHQRQLEQQQQRNTSIMDSNLSSENIAELMNNWKRPVLKFVPKKARSCVASYYCRLIDEVCSTPNNISLWIKLFIFPFYVLQAPKRGGKSNASSSDSIKNRLSSFNEIDVFKFPDFSSQQMKSQSKKKQADNIVRDLAVSKIEDGKIKDALRILCEDNSFAPDTENTLRLLQQKHPTPKHPVKTIELSERYHLESTTKFVQEAIQSFPQGSSGGIDGLLPQHLKDIFLNVDQSTDKQSRLQSITNFINLVLSGNVPEIIRPIFFAARLIALNKKDGGVRPIAISNTWRRLVAKLVAKIGSKKCSDLFNGTQFGIGIRSGCEVAVHVTRQILNDHPDYTIIKLDYTNAFNSVSRSHMLEKVASTFPSAYPFISQAYMKPSFLLYNNKIILSQEGVQQGDPLGPLLFCLSIQNIVSKVSCPLNVWYMDDGTIGGPADVVTENLNMINEESKKIGLFLNEKKCEVYSQCDSHKFPTMKVLSKEKFSLLGAPVTEECIKETLFSKLEEMTKTFNLLKLLPRHHAFHVMQKCLGCPQIMSIIRSSPCLNSCHLNNIDTKVREMLESLLNVLFTDTIWNQASLPIKLGGLGVRKMTEVALPAYLSSLASAKRASSLVSDSTAYIAYQQEFCSKTTSDLFPSNTSQKKLDETLCVAAQSKLLQNQNPRETSRLLSVFDKKSGDWLKVTPNSSLGLVLEDDEFRVAVCLRLGARTNSEHVCKCGAVVDELGDHGFRCSRNNGRILRHSMLNDCVSRALQTAGIPNKLEPSTIGNADNIRPDGVTVMPFAHGKSLTWDVSCPHPMCPSHFSTNNATGKLASSVETNKNRKYESLTPRFIFSPIVIDTMGAYGSSTSDTISDICQRIQRKTGSNHAGAYFRQRLAINIQKGNYLCIAFSLF